MPHRHHGRIARLALLGLLFLLCLGGASYVYFDQISAIISPGSSAGGGSSQANRINWKQASSPKPRDKFFYLAANQDAKEFDYPGILLEELFRQGLLIAARDEMGLQTRDASLREWRDAPPAGDMLEMDLRDKDLAIHDADDHKSAWLIKTYPTWPGDFDKGVAKIEAMSRKDFVTTLRNAGWTGNGNVQKADGDAPADAEEKLSEMEELSQFAVLRETDALIRGDGESPARMGALVRAYANLGQLTRYHWSLEYAVYTARSMLYAQRMVVENPKSAFALWHRAYARAMAGTFKGALDDLNAAAKLPGETPPDWVQLLEPFCRYQTGKLVNLATADPKVATLGTYLAFLSVENCESQGAAMSMAQAAFTMNPHCLRVVDAMCARTGPGMLNELSQTGPRIFSQLMGSRLQKMPSFPQPLSDQIESFKRREGNPQGREIICQALIARGAPASDNIEPSWAALGRMIQETTFEHVRVMADLMARQWATDASDYVNESRPLVAEHPYKFVIDTLGVWRWNNMDAVPKVLVVPQSILPMATQRQIPLYFMLQQSGADSAGYWRRIVRNGDYTAFDLEGVLQYARKEANQEPWVVDDFERLHAVSPESPTVIAQQVCHHFKEAEAVKFEEEHGDYPTVAAALGQSYVNLKRWPDAERCWKKYVAVAPDYEGYEALAGVYKEQKQDDRWLATLNDYLNRGQDYGLQFSQVQEEIANYYMGKKDFKGALPYADAAAQTASAAGMFCAADAHTGLGEWGTAEQLLKDEVDHYSDTPFRWYRWCSRTGHGDLAGARQAFQDYIANKGARADSDDLMDLACSQLGSGDKPSALATFQRRLSQKAGPLSGIYIAMIDDELHDTAGRDAMLARIPKLPDYEQPIGKSVAILLKTMETKPAELPDLTAIEAIAKSTDGRSQVAIFASTGRYLMDHRHSAEATGYFKRCVTADGYYSERLWVDPELRREGVDPWLIDPTGPYH